MKQPALFATGSLVLAGTAWWLALPGTPELTAPLVDDGTLAKPNDARVAAFHFVELNAEALMEAAPMGAALFPSVNFRTFCARSEVKRMSFLRMTWSSSCLKEILTAMGLSVIQNSQD